ncbi:MAG: HAD family hydrolase [Verrucomicrobiota bacterium]|nr:HAD family hydrolase [Verrucomicrobiota bacterium]
MNPETPISIAMWSGPRNISTAMMRAWENRPDTIVVDEPFYAFYLERTKADHPGREEVISAGETDWRKVVASLTSDPLPPGKRIFYQKQMTHHLLPEIGRDWLLRLTNCFLIRDPAAVIASYMRKNDDPEVQDLGYLQQRELFEFVRRATGAIPPVIDARSVRKDPERTLRLLCEAIGVEFHPSMLSWPPGRRETDGVWAKHWYAEVERSTSFEPYVAKQHDVPDRLHHVYRECLEIYDELRQHRLR